MALAAAIISKFSRLDVSGTCFVVNSQQVDYQMHRQGRLDMRSIHMLSLQVRFIYREQIADKQLFKLRFGPLAPSLFCFSRNGCVRLFWASKPLN